MSSGARIPLAVGQNIGVHLVEILEPFCERIELAGSVRRRRSTVGDLEVLVIPKWGGGQCSLFGEEEGSWRNLLHDFLVGACADPARNFRAVQPGRGGKIPDLKFSTKASGKKWTLWTDETKHHPGLQVEIYVQTSETWGVNMMIRTGPAEFGIAMLTRWKSITRGYSRDARLYHGDASIVDTPEEADVFEACQIPWIKPAERNRNTMIGDPERWKT